MENNHHKMYIIAIFSVIITITNVRCPPVAVNDISMLDAILLKCPILSKHEKFMIQNHALWESCNNWTKNIAGIKQISKENEDNVACLLYYDSITKICTGLSDNIEQNNKILLPDLSAIKFSCENFTQILQEKPFKHELQNMITSSYICDKVCYEYNGKPKYSCFMAYYFASLQVKPVIPAQNAVIPATNAGSLPQIVNKNLNPQPDTQDISGPKKVESFSPLGKSDNIEEAHNIKNSNPQGNNVVNKTVASDSKVKTPVPINRIEKPSQETHESNAAQEQVAKVQKKPDHTDNIPPENPETPPTASQEKKTPLDGQKQPSAEQQTPSNTKPVNPPSNTKPVNEPPSDNKPVKEKPAEGKPAEGNSAQVKKTGENIPLDESENADVQNDANLEQSAVNPDEGEVEEGMNYNRDGEADNVEAPPAKSDQKDKVEVVEEKKAEKPSTLDDEPANYSSTDDLSGDSYFLSYFTVIVCLFFVGYVGYHNRQKILALLLEGKKGRRAQRGRRPNSANYHKLDSNLEEALTSSCNKNNSHIIY